MHFDQFASVPVCGSLQREDRFGDVLLDRNRNVVRLDLIGVDRFETERPRLVANDSAGVQRERKAIHGHNGLCAVFLEHPVNFLRPAGLCGKCGRLALQHSRLRWRHGDGITRLHQRTDQRLQGFLVFVLQPHPVCRARDFGDSHLVDIAGKTIVVVPAANPHLGEGRNCQGRVWGDRDAIKLAVQVNA